eukprot:scaffold6263_cov107-Amphora_coffeaeformis.AAC.2
MVRRQQATCSDAVRLAFQAILQEHSSSWAVVVTVMFLGCDNDDEIRIRVLISAEGVVQVVIMKATATNRAQNEKVTRCWIFVPRKGTPRSCCRIMMVGMRNILERDIDDGNNAGEDEEGQCSETETPTIRMVK